MSEVPQQLKYTASHEWVQEEDNGLITVGITAHAQDLLGEMVFVELPEMDIELDVGDECAVVESVKAASDVYAPIAGRVVEVNQGLDDDPGAVNREPYEDGWLFRLQAAEPKPMDNDNLLSAAQYTEQLGEAD